MGFTAFAGVRADWFVITANKPRYIELHYIGKRTISSDPSIFKDLDHLLDQVAFEFKLQNRSD